MVSCLMYQSNVYCLLCMGRMRSYIIICDSSLSLINFVLSDLWHSAISHMRQNGLDVQQVVCLYKTVYIYWIILFVSNGTIGERLLVVIDHHINTNPQSTVCWRRDSIHRHYSPLYMYCSIRYAYRDDTTFNL